MNVAETICEAWRKKKPEQLNDILADTFLWYEDPFNKPIADKAKLLELWEKDLSNQEKVKLSSTNVYASGSQEITHWSASYEVNDTKFHVDGVFIIKLNKQGKLTEFRQWWVKK